MRSIRDLKTSRISPMNSLRSCARLVASLRARRRAKPNCIHLQMTLSKTGHPQKVAACQDRRGMANPNASWIAVARRSRDTAIAPAKVSRQPAHHHPPPELRVSPFPLLPFRCPPPSIPSKRPSKDRRSPRRFAPSQRPANAPASWIAVALHRFSHAHRLTAHAFPPRSAEQYFAS